MRERVAIVVGYDGSANARDGVVAAADIVADEGTVHVVTAYRLPSVSEVSRLWDELPAEFRASFDPLIEPESYQAEALKILGGRSVNAVGHLIDGDAASAILDVADEVDADLVVVGSRGLGRATRFVKGSVSSKVTNHVKTSLLVIRAEDPHAAA